MDVADGAVVEVQTLADVFCIRDWKKVLDEDVYDGLDKFMRGEPPVRSDHEAFKRYLTSLVHRQLIPERVPYMAPEYINEYRDSFVHYFRWYLKHCYM